MIVTAGTTSVSVYFYIIQDASATSPGEPVTGLLFSDIETGGSASYMRQGAARTDFALITLASASAAYASGGFILVDDTNMPGLYRCDVPNAAFAAGVDHVFIQLVVASANNAVVAPLMIEITDFDLQTANVTLAAATHTGAVIPTVTSLTNLPAIPTNWLTAAGINAGALDGKGDWNIGKSGYALTVANWNVGKTGYALTTQDWNVGKTGYSLTQAFPANFASLSISAGGLVDILQTAADKVWATATRQLSSLQANLITAVSIAAAALNGKGDWNIGKSGYSISGTITTLDGLNNFDPTSDNVAVVTTLSNLPTIPANWLTVAGIADNAFAAAKFAAASLNGKGDWNTVVPLTAAQTEAEVNDALVVLHLDHLLAVDYNPAAKPGVATALLNELVESDGGVSRFTANALEQVMASTLSELSSIPAATPTVGQALMLPFMGIRNKRDTTATSDEVHNSAGGIVATAVLSDDTVVFTKEKYT